MKTKLAIAVIVAAAAAWGTHATATPECAHANYRCGLKPLPPLGCKRSDAVCICERSGDYGQTRCRWVWVGC